ncbi:MAG: hypothetical protein ACK4X1_13075 [Terricaulis sp.]
MFALSHTLDVRDVPVETIHARTGEALSAARNDSAEYLIITHGLGAAALEVRAAVLEAVLSQFVDTKLSLQLNEGFIVALAQEHSHARSKLRDR